MLFIRFLFTFALCFFALGHPAAGQTTCQFFTKADAEALFQRSVDDPISRIASVPAGNTCRYAFSHAGDRYGVTIRISTTQEIVEEGIFESAHDVMVRQKQARMKHDYASQAFREISDLGDDAFWGGTDLWLLKGDTLAVITVNSVLEGLFPDMDTMNKAMEENNQQLSLSVAKTMLSRLL